jgi:hypothetical protein
LRFGHFGGSRVGIELLLRDLGLGHQRTHARQVRLRLLVVGFGGRQIRTRDGPVRGCLAHRRIRLRHLRLGGVQAADIPEVPLCVVSRVSGTVTCAACAWLSANASAAFS